MSTAGLSKTRLGRMADVMRGYVERGEVAGVATLLCRHDQVHVEAIGQQDLAAATPMRGDTYPIQKAMIEAGLAPGPDPLPFSADEFLARLGRLPLMHQPGEQWMYHTGSDILGALIARATGVSLGDFLQERIFAPLGTWSPSCSPSAS